MRGDRRLLSAAPAQRCRGAAPYRRGRGADGLRDGRDGRTGRRLHAPAWAWPLYAAVFGAAALRALWAARTDTHHLHHLVGAAAMVYMALAMAGRPAAARDTGTGAPDSRR
ncbi:hypothetical protein GCM10020295_09640 [Streptomyces cinereospinus]